MFCIPVAQLAPPKHQFTISQSHNFTFPYSSVLSLPPVTFTRLPVMKEPSWEASST